MSEKSSDPVEILLVEDNSADIELTLHTLKKHHIANHIEVMRDGVQALDYIFCTDAYADHGDCPAPQVILLDLRLPKVDGLEVLRRIKTDLRTKTIPVVVLTSSREQRDVVESYELGVNSYIVEPVDFDQFAEAVQQLGLYWLFLNEKPSF